VNLEKIREAAERVARSEGLEIADVEWKVGKQRFLRVYIDRVPPGLSDAPLRQDSEQALRHSGQASPALTETPANEAALDEVAETGGGDVPISHADCERVSKQLSVILDVEELIPGPGYILEVSSPGLDRALTKPGDFQRFKGRLAKISTAEPIGDAKFFEGRLAGFADGKVRMELKGREARVVEVPLEAIRKANLVVEF
jgi:ribosome maturation factor RimP